MSEKHSKEELLALSTKVADAYNANDIEAIVSLFADDGVFCNGDGKSYTGLQEIRSANEEVLQLGKLSFEGEEVFADVDDQKVLLGWVLTIAMADQEFVCRGLDVLHFSANKLTLKSTFFKTEMPVAIEATVVASAAS